MKYLIFSVLLIACHTSSKETDENFYKPNSTTKLVKDIPAKNGKYPYYYRKKSEYEKKIGLTSLETGFDSLEIRIHYDIALAYEGQTIILQKNQSGWIGKLYHEKYNVFPSDTLRITTEEKNVSPKSGWKSFINKLYNLDILTLEDASKINDYGGGCQDGDGVLIQIATMTKYRIYQYPCLSFVLQEQDIWQAKNVEKILETLESELNFKRVELTP